MNSTGLEVFDSTISKTNAWLHDVMREGGLDDKHQAYRALRAVLHVLRDKYPPGEAAALGAQLPMLLRGLYYEGWRPSDTPVRMRHKGEFVDRVRAELAGGEAELAARLVRAVFVVMGLHISPESIDHFRRSLPREIEELWPAPAGAASGEPARRGG